MAIFNSYVSLPCWTPIFSLNAMPDPPESGGAPNAGAAPGPGTALATPGSIQSPMAEPVKVEVGSQEDFMGFVDVN